MHKGWTQLLTIAAAATFAGAAYAADMPVKSAPVAPPPAVPSWTGFYVGIDGGAVFGSPDQKFSFFPGTFAAFDPVDFGNSHQVGGVGGFLAGYNWQFAPSWVVGIEGDYNWASLSSTNSTVPTITGIPVPGFGLQMTNSLDWLASVRGRIGWLWTPSTLFYATGGVAWEGVEYTGTFALGSPPAIAASTANNFTKTNSGWVAGGGVEYMATEHVLVRLEYLFYGFKGNTATVPFCVVGTVVCPFGGASATYNWGHDDRQVVRAAVSYKF